jgi:hypothetical protein
MTAFNDPTPLGLVADAVEQLRRELAAAVADVKAEVAAARLELRQELAQVKEHTARTNGRVSALELWKARAEGVRAVLGHGSTILATLLGGSVVGIIALLAH